MFNVDAHNSPAFAITGLTARDSITYPDVEIPRNKVSFIVGESGSGKTTLLRLFNQTETQTSGIIRFFGNDVSTMDITTLRINAVLCGQKVFLFNGTIRENFNEFRRYVAANPKESNSLSDETMRKFLSICCAEQDLDKDCENLSGGERARVFIAIHLAFTPAVLMLDEPTSALDTETAMTMMKNIASYCSENEMTLIVISHDRKVIDAVADNIVDLGGKKNG